MDYPWIFPSAFGKHCTGDKGGNLSQICSKMSKRFSPLFMGSFKRITSCFLPRTTGDWPQAWGIHYMRLALKFLKDRGRVFSSVYLICSSLLDETQDTLWKFIETSVSCSLRGRLRFFFFKTYPCQGFISFPSPRLNIHYLSSCHYLQMPQIYLSRYFIE